MPSERPRRIVPVHHAHHAHHAHHTHSHSSHHPHSARLPPLGRSEDSAYASFQAELGVSWPSRHPNPYPYARGSRPAPVSSSLAPTTYLDARHHERGHSEPLRSPSRAAWKDLPPLPSSYRLGEGLPWDMGLSEPAADPDDERLQPSAVAFTRPMLVPIEPAPPGTDDEKREDPQRKRHLEDLSAAMMTVDNGFESQWWNCGAKTPTLPFPIIATVEADDDDEAPPSPTPRPLFAPPAPPAPPQNLSLGWAVAAPHAPRGPARSAAASPDAARYTYTPYSPAQAGGRARSFSAAPQHDAYIVSPESEYPGSCGPWSPLSAMSSLASRHASRSMPTRSEELFFTTEQYI